MGEFKCKRCELTFNFKSLYIRHVNKTKLCEIKNTIIAPETIPEVTDEGNENITKVKDNEINFLEIDKKIYKCKYCDKTFSRNAILKKHMNNTCKTMLKQALEEKKNKSVTTADIIDDLVKKMNSFETALADLRKENEKLKDKGIINQTNIQQQQNIQQNIQQNNNVNIKLVAYGKEDLSFLVDDVIKKILNRGAKSVIHLVEFIHFNKDKPENQNIYISNMQNGCVGIYDGDKWQLKERDTVLTDMVSCKSDFLECKFEELKENLDESIIRKFNRYVAVKDDNVIVNGLKKDLKMLLYNKGDMIEKNQKKINQVAT